MGSKDAGLSPAVQQGELNNSTALTQLAAQQSANSNTLFNEANPGVVQAENFYGDLSTGDPSAIARAIAPVAQQVNQATVGARTNIMNNSPAGGERNLALEQADVNQGAQVGGAASNGYLNSFNALGQLGGTNIGLGNSAASTATGAATGANQGLGQLGNQQIEQKGAGLGAVTSLAGSLAGGLATAF
jgi:hypothetical protein